MDNLIRQLHPLERKVLPFLKDSSAFSDLVSKSGLKDIEVMRALQWLQNKQIIILKEEIKETVSLDSNGEEYLKKKLPERRFLEVLSEKPHHVQHILKAAKLNEAELNICLGILKGKAAISLTKESGSLNASITSHGKSLLGKESLEESFLNHLPKDTGSLKDEEKFALDSLLKRKGIIKVEKHKLKFAELTSLGRKLLESGISDKEVIDRLTPAIIKSGAWKQKGFRAYDIKINVPSVYFGKRHFVNQAIEYIKRIWLDLGFTEMEGNMLQTAFWDLDSLFVPQDHPAREMQDTFYISGKKGILGGSLPQPLAKNVKATHEDGWTTGSKGWRSPWSEAKAKEVLMRTHTTVLSAQTINRLKESELPAKFFSVNRVFRNETLDWKHLFEFHQVEGIVVDPNANFRHLKGYLREFYTKMGYKDVRMRPAHFPYTEPSVEVDVLHPEKNEWIELGGAGIFRPEVVKPLLGKDIPVLAWGQGMERIITSYFGITDLRDVYKNDMKQIREMKTWLL